MKDWKATVDLIFERPCWGFAHTLLTVSTAVALQAEVLLQEIIIWSGIKFAQMTLQRWFTEPYRQACVMGVYRNEVIGKTSLLKLVYNHYIKVSGIKFDLAIWLLVSNSECEENRSKDSIVQTLNLNLDESSAIDMREMKLYACLEKKYFLLILDDVWSPTDLNTMGVKFLKLYSCLYKEEISSDFRRHVESNES